MKHSITTGFSFGLTSGVITTLGLMVGLNAGTDSRMVVIGGILTIAIADAFSDALGIHISEESELKHSAKEIWVSTLSTFFSKFLFASSFLVPIFFLPLHYAIFVSVLYGIIVLICFSYILAKYQKERPFKIILEHIFIACIVILFSHLTGTFIKNHFYK